MEERKSVEQADAAGKQADDAGKQDGCEKFNPPAGTGTNESIRKLLRELEGELAGMEPTEATKKFGDDLKDADKEYQSLGAVIAKYKEFYNKLDLRLAEARSWKQDIKQGCDEVDQDTRRKIRRLREDSYDEVEEQRLCDWLESRGELIRLGDCLSQARKEEEQAADDYKAFKEFEKNLTAKFTDLAALWKRATELIEEERFKAVCAVGAEFREVYYNLGTVITWKEVIEECNKGADELAPAGVQGAKGQQDRGGQDAGGQDEGDDAEQDEKRLKRPPSPDDLKEKLTEYLRALILAKYQRFRSHNKVLKAEADNNRAKESFERFRKSRRAEFIQEAEDVEAVKPTAQTAQPAQPAQPGQPAPPTQY